jgi:hypothetical protein
MKRILAVLCFLPGLGIASPFDLLVQQKNIADTATLTRVVNPPALGINSVFGLSDANNLPILWRLNPSIVVFNGELVAAPDWTLVQGKPTFATVATTGNYNDLINKPSTAPQVNSDWSATSGVEEILNKPTLATVATSGAYADLSGAPSIPAAQVNSDWAAGGGISEVLNKPTTLAGYGITDAYPRFGNPSNFLTGVTGSQVIAALGFTPYNSANTSNFVDQAGARAAISLTTTGAGGAATYNSSTGALNVPNYTPSRSQSSATRALNTAFQISATRDAMASYSVQCVITASIAGGQSCDVILEIATDAAFTTGVQTVGIAGTGQTYTLAVALQGVQPQTSQLFGYVPAGYYARIRTVSVTGAPSFSMRAGQEILQ